MKHTLPLLTTLILSPLAALHAADKPDGSHKPVAATISFLPMKSCAV